MKVLKRDVAKRDVALAGLIAVAFMVPLLLYKSGRGPTIVAMSAAQIPSRTQLSLVWPIAEEGDKTVMIHALDYRRVAKEVYEPANYALCPTAYSNGREQCWPQLTTPVDCVALFNDYLHVLETHQPVFPGPSQLPADQRDTFLLQNYTKLTSMYFGQMTHAPSAEVPVWTLDTIKDVMAKTKARQAVGSYNVASMPIYQALDCHAVEGLRGAVFGTEIPWLEGMLFAYGE